MIKLVSIIIPVFNEVDAIEKLVENTQNLRNLGLNFEYEIIIVDDGSTDGTGATLKEIQLTNQNLHVVSLGETMDNPPRYKPDLITAQGCADNNGWRFAK